MAYTFRTSGPWGPGIGMDLTPTQVDQNFYQAIQDIQAKAAQGVGISNFVVTGNQMTVVLTDHTLLGPYTLPMAQISFRGEWVPNTDYYAGNVITHAGSTYMVEVNHTSAATFDPGANDGAGNDFYGLLLQNPACTIPAGGPTGYFLRKATSADYSVAWEIASLDDLSDVLIGRSPANRPTNGEALIYEAGIWQNLPIPPGTLEQLSDVSITNSPAPVNGQVLTYESGTWINQVVSAPSLEQLSDVSIANSPAPVNGQVLTYESGTWINQAITLSLGQLTDVAVASPAAGQPLVWNGSKWADVSTVDMPCGGLTPVNGNVTIDRTVGEVHRLQLTGTATLVSIIGWPPGGQFARVVLEIQNTGTFGFAWPPGVLWPSGAPPSVTPNGKDIFILITMDGGTTIYGNVCGQAYA